MGYPWDKYFLVVRDKSGYPYAIRGTVCQWLRAKEAQLKITIIKDIANLIHLQKETFEKISIPNEHISKSNQGDSEMLTLVSERAQYGKNASIHENLLYIMKSFHLVFVHLLSSFGGVISNNRVLAALRSAWF